MYKLSLTCMFHSVMINVNKRYLYGEGKPKMYDNKAITMANHFAGLAKSSYGTCKYFNSDYSSLRSAAATATTTNITPFTRTCGDRSFKPLLLQWLVESLSNSLF